MQNKKKRTSEIWLKHKDPHEELLELVFQIVQNYGTRLQGQMSLSKIKGICDTIKVNVSETFKYSNINLLVDQSQVEEGITIINKWPSIAFH